ncbi:hypothetical protein AK812_SmicGene19564 [Symbiodinium microadriaticum]|uniref:Uncharacterized protein n=1 Tax=Symbiodinium microadriaticum TaxID=2951 RepID=A0A1Q9DS87_SYMMI|nr:hypothetical protein AK812_SmicGene19564 [Symbiodinium microadriaticum]
MKKLLFYSYLKTIKDPKKTVAQSKYAGVWRSWRMPKSYWNSSNGADPKKPQRMRPCGCCCGFEEQIRVCSSVHCSGKSPPKYCRP